MPAPLDRRCYRGDDRAQKRPGDRRRTSPTDEAPSIHPLDLIDRLDQLVGEAKPVPLTSEARIDREEAYRLLDQIRTTLPAEFERARSMGREDDQAEGLESQLRQIETSIAELREAQQSQAQRHSHAPLDPAEAEQVREIIEAAKVTASRLEAEAASKARVLKEEAQSELRAAREKSERIRRESPERAEGEAAAYLRRVEEATKKMLERAARADSEINEMLAPLRDSGDSVIEDLEAIVADLKELQVRQTRGERAHEGETRREPTAPVRPGLRDWDESPSPPKRWVRLHTGFVGSVARARRLWERTARRARASRAYSLEPE